MLYDTSVYHNIVSSVQNHKLQVNFCFILIYVCCSFNVEYVQLFFSHIGDIFPLVKEYLDVISLCLMCSLHRHIKQSGDLNTCSKFCLYRTDLFRPSQIGALLYLLFLLRHLLFYLRIIWENFHQHHFSVLKLLYLLSLERGIHSTF